MNTPLEHFCDAYSGDLLSKDLSLFRRVYSDDVCFIDPVHELSGIDALMRYFHDSIAGLSSCEFVIDNAIAGEEDEQGLAQAAVQWRMHYSSPRLDGGKPLCLNGSSVLKMQSGRVCYHRDYFDLGSMVYEHVPVLKRLVLALKRRLQA